MNAVEIEEAVSALAEAPFDANEFPFSFLSAFGNKEATIKRLRTGNTNKSDVGGVLQRNNIHIAVAPEGQTVETLANLRASAQTQRQKAKFILATDGTHFEAEEIVSGDVASGPLADLGNHFGFFLPLAGISTVKEVKNNPIDIKATGRLNRLYVQILKDNPDWQAAGKRSDLNRFMARLIFCFFAEDTGIFPEEDLFTTTVRTMTEADGSNTHDVLLRVFAAMNCKAPDGAARPGFPSWADAFPYVNGGLFQDDIGCPTFTRTSRAYLLRAGELDWKTINPDIFGSMIQAVADDDERGELGMHYTSVPNIQKVLDPLFLDDLREQLEAAGTNKRKLFNLRQRLSRFRVFDPACGSGNFLVIAYIRMREIEDEIMRRRDEALERSAISLTQFYGIEIKSFAAEIARLSLLIAEFQCDVRFIGQMEARALVLPLHATGTIVTGNALRIDWETVCPPVTASAEEQDLGGPTGRLNLEGVGEDWETYICGNPPFRGARKQAEDQKAELCEIFDGGNDYKDCDYVSGWFLKASHLLLKLGQNSEAALVSTNSICEGEQVQHIWSHVFDNGCRIQFAHRPFKWKNNAANNAGVYVVVVGFGRRPRKRKIYDDGNVSVVDSISPYLFPGPAAFVSSEKKPLSGLQKMVSGSMPRDGGHLIMTPEEKSALIAECPDAESVVRKFCGSSELMSGADRFCLWIEDGDLDVVRLCPSIQSRIHAVRNFRESSSAKTTKGYASIPHKFAQRSHSSGTSIVVAKTSSERREYFPADLKSDRTVISDAAFTLHNVAIWYFSILTSKLHQAWIETVCGKLKADYRYSTTLAWNTFPVPRLTETDKANLSQCAEDILLARERHFPATIAELYDPEKMPEDLRAAHDRNDETLERIYIGRRFRNDTERLEKLFNMYTKMTAKKEKTS
tara:strand:- start:7577 stop:10309 length:2733 start_codon:yes stop_codon:yes gene_type:complete